MTATEQAAHDFAARWEGKGYEKGQSQIFWTELLTEVFGIRKPSEFISFEDQVKLDHTSFIDGYIQQTHVMIEQKSLGKDLQKPIRQSDGTELTPFEQAKRYASELPYSQRPRWIVTCNFSDFLVYDMERPQGDPVHIALKDLGKEYYRLNFLVDDGSALLQREMEVSMKAGELVGKIYDLLIRQYIDPSNPSTLQSLNILCVRLVFCLYAEDAGVFGRHNMFHDYLARFEARDLRRALLELFRTLNTPQEQRDPYMDEDLAAFPYTNGGLFAREDVEIPNFTEELRTLLLQHASLDFDWSEISPTIFGGVFESTLNPETRRSGGMHYTSIENIHKVIDPLFLDALEAELDAILAETVQKKRLQRLRDYQDKLASLTFFDPACGSGNFLTETYLSLRRLENRVIQALYSVNSLDAFTNPIKVSIRQFYGIEINDFAVTVATTALWISEAQMMAETERIISHDIDFLPLKSYANIREGNALRMDWREVLATPLSTLHTPLYIIGNPPFVGYSLQSKEQKQDMLNIYVDEKGRAYKTAGKIDYVAAWYFKAAQLMQGTSIRAALVSTNSITQGEQVAAVWRPLYDRFGIQIDFAHRTFRWDSEASLKAHVHCVVVGFSCCGSGQPKLLFDSQSSPSVPSTPLSINPYLLPGSPVFVETRKHPLCDVPEMVTGNRPADGGHLIIEADEYDDFIRREPKAAPYIKRLVGAEEYINNKKRWCLWLVGVSPAIINALPLVKERVRLCKEARLGGASDRQKLADAPTLFRETLNPDTSVIIPVVSSQNREYVPMGYIDKETICTDRIKFLPNATLYHFGVLQSSVHMAWMRAVCGRLKSDYNYSKDIVYNNFVWPTANESQAAQIAQTAQAILDARSLYPDSTLADLYDPLLMPQPLRKAHRENDRAVLKAYGWPADLSEEQMVSRLFALYEAKAKE